MYAAASGDFFDFESTWRAVQPEDIVTLIYTSGTTGNPKGVEMTHANLLFEGYAIDEVLGIRFGDRVTSFLPSAHIADRMTGLYLQEMFGTQVTAVADARTIAAALPDVRPTVWGAVPRVWEKLKAGIEFTVARETDEMKRQALAWAMSVAGKRANALLAGESMSDQLVAEWAKADELVLSKLRERLGFGELRWALSGAAPIPKETLAFFAGIGIPIAEIWGMSELSCVATASHPQRGLDASPAALAADPEVIARIAAGVAEGNAKLSRVEQIKRFRILPTLWEPGGDEITLTMKLKRRRIAAKYSAEIEELYASELRPQVYEPAAVPSTQPA